jgi:hypothetical protein
MKADKNKNPIITYGYNHLEIGDPDNPKPYRICGALTRNEAAKSKYCMRPAGHGTDHVGVGRCKLHGGMCLAGPANPRWTGGRYASIYKGRLAEYYKGISQDDTNPLDVLPELEAQRVIFLLALDRLASSNSKKMGSAERLGRSDDEIGASGMVGDGGGRSIGDEDTLVDIQPAEFLPPDIQNHINAPPLPANYSRVREEDIQLCRDLGNDIINTVNKMISIRNQTAMTRGELLYLMANMKEAINLFVPKEKQRAFVEYLMEKVPIFESEEEEGREE